MSEFKTYEAARAAAQKQANDMARAAPSYALKGGCDYGLERNEVFGFYRVFLLPTPTHRFGHELRCEVVLPEVNRF